MKAGKCVSIVIPVWLYTYPSYTQLACRGFSLESLACPLLKAGIDAAAAIALGVSSLQFAPCPLPATSNAITYSQCKQYRFIYMNETTTTTVLSLPGHALLDDIHLI